MRLFLFTYLTLLCCVACDTKHTAQTTNASDALPAPSESIPKKSEEEIIVENIKKILSEKKANEIYTKACNKNIERIPTECNCLANFLQKKLPYLMFALEASSEAGENDLSASIINTMDDMKLDFRRAMGETRMLAWDACLTEGIKLQ